MYYLHIRPLGGVDRRAPLTSGPSTIGRLHGNTIVLEEYGVSGRHAEVEVDRDEVVVRDLGSTNGVFVNGRRVDRARVFPGDRILLGTVVAVLQEAISDRIRVYEAGSAPVWEVGGAAQGVPVHPSVAQRTYVPTVSRAAATADAPEDEDRDSAALLELIQEVLGAFGSPGETSTAMGRAMGAISRYLGVPEAHLVGIRGPEEYFLLASTSPDREVVIARGVLRQLVETGTEVCMEVADRPGEGCIVLPLAASSHVFGALYLEVPVDGTGEARDRVAKLRPLTAVLSLVVQRIQAHSELRRTRLAIAAGAELPAHAEGFRPTVYEIVAHSPGMREVLDRIGNLADDDRPLVLRGEPGTGKERSARRLHASGPRRRAPFLVFGSGLSPAAEEFADLFGVESELGGEPRRGKLELAEGGTVLFDEISDLARETQAAVARLLRTGEVVRAGGTNPVPVRIRLVFASSRAADGAGLPAGIDPELADVLGDAARIEIPPLRERREDVIPLAQVFARHAASASRKRVVGLSMDACRAMREYPWPGNVLELQNVVGRAVLLATDAILDVDLLPADIAGLGADASPGLPPFARDLKWRDAKKAFEKAYFEQLFRQNRGNVAKSARDAGIARKSFYDKVREHGLETK